MKQSSHKLASDFNNYESDQTDFGNTFFNTPSEVVFPETIQDLALTLKNYNGAGKAVTIRNTGHSMNGQSLTNGVQINLSNLNRINFRKDELLVDVEAGTPWYKVFEAINLPEYTTGVFPNNPGQKIHIGGTATAGGIGLLSAKYGGFWNIVEAITLVTMTGEIINCTKTENSDYFYYSLGGWGRIGVVAKLTIRVFKPKSPNIVILTSLYLQGNKIISDYIKDIPSENYLGELSVMNIGSPLIKGTDISTNGLIHFLELDDDLIQKIKKTMSENATLYGTLQTLHEDLTTDMELGIGKSTTDIKKLAFFYPQMKGNVSERYANPWADYLVREKDYLPFMEGFTRILRDNDVTKFIMREHSKFLNMDLEVVGNYKIKKVSETLYPLTLDFDDSDLCMEAGICFQVPPEHLEQVEKAIAELDELVFSFNGKRYLYGRHNLTKEQVEIQYGKETIKKWNELKKVTDPKNLLNIGVVEHLDD